MAVRERDRELVVMAGSNNDDVAFAAVYVSAAAAVVVSDKTRVVRLLRLWLLQWQ